MSVLISGAAVTRDYFGDTLDLTLNPRAPSVGEHLEIICQKENASEILLTIFGDLVGSFVLQTYHYDVRNDALDHGTEFWRKNRDVTKVFGSSKSSLRIRVMVTEEDRVQVRCIAKVRRHKDTFYCFFPLSPPLSCLLSFPIWFCSLVVCFERTKDLEFLPWKH